MDDFIQVILFVAGVIYFIVKSVNKQKNKISGQSINNKDFLDSFLGGEKEQQIFSESLISNLEQQHDESIKFESSVKNTISKNNEEFDVNAEEYEEEFLETEDVFDLRSAVIYSEIMNRKYQ